MPKKDTSEWKPGGRGRYRRMVGWRNEGDKSVQRPFYFGTDLDQAKGRYLRVSPQAVTESLDEPDAERSGADARQLLGEVTDCFCILGFPSLIPVARNKLGASIGIPGAEANPSSIVCIFWGWPVGVNDRVEPDGSRHLVEVNHVSKAVVLPEVRSACLDLVFE